MARKKKADWDVLLVEKYGIKYFERLQARSAVLGRPIQVVLVEGGKGGTAHVLSISEDGVKRLQAWPRDYLREEQELAEQLAAELAEEEEYEARIAAKRTARAVLAAEQINHRSSVLPRWFSPPE